MANLKEGVYESILKCAQKEFLDKGYEGASLRAIALSAATSTGSIYTRFGNKEQLFAAIVDPVYSELKRLFIDMQEVFHQFDAETQENRLDDYCERSALSLIDFLYQHPLEIELLLQASGGTPYERFMDELIEIEVAYTYKYMEATNCGNSPCGDVMETLLHMVTTSYFNGLFEIFRHHMPKDQGLRYSKLLGIYHRAGFEKIFFSKEAGQ